MFRSYTEDLGKSLSQAKVRVKRCFENLLTTKGRSLSSSTKCNSSFSISTPEPRDQLTWRRKGGKQQSKNGKKKNTPEIPKPAAEPSWCTLRYATINRNLNETYRIRRKAYYKRAANPFMVATSSSSSSTSLVADDDNTTEEEEEVGNSPSNLLSQKTCCSTFPRIAPSRKLDNINLVLPPATASAARRKQIPPPQRALYVAIPSVPPPTTTTKQLPPTPPTRGLSRETTTEFEKLVQNWRSDSENRELLKRLVEELDRRQLRRDEQPLVVVADDGNSSSSDSELGRSTTISFWSYEESGDEPTTRTEDSWIYPTIAQQRIHNDKQQRNEANRNNNTSGVGATHDSGYSDRSTSSEYCGDNEDHYANIGPFIHHDDHVIHYHEKQRVIPPSAVKSIFV